MVNIIRKTIPKMGVLVKQPEMIVKLPFNRANVQWGLLFGGYVAIYRVKYKKRQSKWWKSWKNRSERCNNFIEREKARSSYVRLMGERETEYFYDAYIFNFFYLIFYAFLQFLGCKLSDLLPQHFRGFICGSISGSVFGIAPNLQLLIVAITTLFQVNLEKTHN